MPQTRKLVGALGLVFGLAVLAFAITAGGAQQAFGQQTSTPSTGGTTAAAGTGTTTTVSGTPTTGGTSITTTGTRTAVAGSPTAGAAAGAQTLPSSGTGVGGGSSTLAIWMIAGGALIALLGAGALASGVRKRG